MVALAAATTFVAVYHPASIATIGSAFGGIPRGLPGFAVPKITLPLVVELMQPAVAVALLGAIESLLSATVADGMAGTRHDPNQELIGQGIANLGAGLFGGFAATGAIARTATNIRHGGDSPIAGLAHAATIAIVLIALAPLAFYVPLTVLAAILFVVAFNMSQIARLVRVVGRAPRSDVAVMLTTLALSVFADISLAVEVGVILALLNFFRRMVSTVEVRNLGHDDLAARLTAEQAAAVPPGVLVYSVDGPFFFGAVEEFESALLHSGTDPDAVVLKLVNVPFIDMTGLAALKDAVAALDQRGIPVALCGANAEVASRLERAHVGGTVELAYTAQLAEALAAIRERPAA
jgi:SulP family sulfate permease